MIACVFSLQLELGLGAGRERGLFLGRDGTI